jgi:hypothetical protein
MTLVTFTQVDSEGVITHRTPRRSLRAREGPQLGLDEAWSPEDGSANSVFAGRLVWRDNRIPVRIGVRECFQECVQLV